MLTYNSVFEILENDIRLKKTSFNFLPLTYKGGRKIDLTLGDLITDFFRFLSKKASWSLHFCLFVIDIQG